MSRGLMRLIASADRYRPFVPSLSLPRPAAERLRLLTFTLMSSSSASSCPDCQSRTVHWRNTLSGLLCGILCFPCGIYCCLQRRQQHCTKCDCDVIKSTRIPVNSFGYAYRGYQSIDKGIPPSMAIAYRNTAYSSSSGGSTRGNTDASSNSQTELIHKSTHI